MHKYDESFKIYRSLVFGQANFQWGAGALLRYY